MFSFDAGACGRVQNVVILSTSFGVIVHRELSGERDNVYVYVPRIRDLTGNLEGILGNLDGKRENDGIDANGV